MKRIATTLLVAGLLATPLLALPPRANAGISIGIGVSVGIPPPALPVYAQPIAPGPGYIWTPGYWAWDPGYGYYWVPGTWVMPPAIGLLWTPGWWGWSGGFYRWHAGYWGTHVGFYGGINYGFGYFGVGYVGGYWRGRDFFYNRAVNNINVTNIHNVYVNRTVINNVHVNRVSYNGGRGGISAQPDARQRAWMNERRYQPTAMQAQQREVAMRDPAQRFNANHGRPAVFATQHVGHFEGPHAVRAPAAARARMVAAPEQHARTTMTAPDREHGFVRAPHNRPQMMQPTGQSFRSERVAPPAGRGFAEQPDRARPRETFNPRNEAQGRRGPPPSHGERRGNAPREQRDDGHGHR